MEIEFTDLAMEDVNFWKKSGNKQVLVKISELLNAIKNNPYSGIGKPEALKFQYSGYWSRRINKEHRIIYSVNNETITIFSLKGHYL